MTNFTFELTGSCTDNEITCNCKADGDINAIGSALLIAMHNDPQVAMLVLGVANEYQQEFLERLEEMGEDYVPLKLNSDDNGINLPN